MINNLFPEARYGRLEKKQIKGSANPTRNDVDQKVQKVASNVSRPDTSGTELKVLGAVALAGLVVGGLFLFSNLPGWVITAVGVGVFAVGLLLSSLIDSEGPSVLGEMNETENSPQPSYGRFAVSQDGKAIFIGSEGNQLPAETEGELMKIIQCKFWFNFQHNISEGLFGTFESDEEGNRIFEGLDDKVMPAVTPKDLEDIRQSFEAFCNPKK